MRVRYHKSFQKQAIKLKPAQANKLMSALALFEVNPYHADLYNHALSGRWEGYRSIAFGGDWRTHYRVVNDVTLFVAVVKHSQLYK